MSIRRLLVAFLVAPAAAHADHPLLTEDTGVLGKGNPQVELHGERPRDGGATELAVVLGYGIAERADLQLELPHVRHDGWQDPALALKWRFYEQGPLSMVLKPAVSDDYRAADFAAAYEIGRVEVIGHLGYARVRADGGRESLRHASLAFLYGLTDRLGLVADFGRDSNGETVKTLVLGVTYAPSDDIDLGFGVKAGDERAWLFGAKLRW